MIESLLQYLHYDFVQNALVAGTIAAALGAVVGYFVVVRNVGFAAHALSHIGFTGAAGAVLIGLSPLDGMLLLTIIAGIFIGAIGDRAHRSDMAIGMVLAFALGLGFLFLSLYAGFAGSVTAILFGQIFGVSTGQIFEMALLAILSLAGLAIFSRRLLFASTQPRLAEARGLSLTGLSIAFMIVLAISVALASQVVGILLVFTLVIAPAGIALRLCRTYRAGMISSVALGVGGTWVGILSSCLTNWPPTFCIATIFFVLYLAVEVRERFSGPAAHTHEHKHSH
jgi:zinc/manganese transport system permease protein